MIDVYNGVFKEVANAKTAYWLGFLAADGSVFEDRHRLVLGLQRQDRTHIEKFKDFIGTDANIIDRDVLCSTNGNRYPSSFIYVYDQKLIDDLSQYGIISDKSYKNIDFLQYIPEQYKMHFILGYFDGDGHYVCTQESHAFGWCGCENNIYTITSYTKQYLALTTTAECHRHKKDSIIYEFADTKISDIRIFCEFYLSQNNMVDLLARKMQKAKQLLEFATNTDIRKPTNYANHANRTATSPKRIATCPVCNQLFYVSNKNVGKYCSQKCAHIAQQRAERPDRTKLKELIRTMSFLQIGKLFNVSDNTIRKWCKSMSLPYKSSDIKKYSDQEWVAI